MKRIILLIFILTVSLSTRAVLGSDESGQRLPANGVFTADVDFTTLTLTPVGNNCVLEVEGQLFFTGTLEGAASGKTRAFVLASCADVAVNPPGTFKDVFRSTLEFTGMVNGIPTFADITYQGTTEVGGSIKALMLLSNGLKGNLKVEAIVVLGGTYEGFIIDR